MHGGYVNRKPFRALDERAELYFSETAELRSASREKTLPTPEVLLIRILSNEAYEMSRC